MGKFETFWDKYVSNTARIWLYLNILFISLALPAKFIMWSIDTYVKNWAAWQQGLFVITLATFVGPPLARFAVWLFKKMKV